MTDERWEKLCELDIENSPAWKDTIYREMWMEIRDLRRFVEELREGRMEWNK